MIIFYVLKFSILAPFANFSHPKFAQSPTYTRSAVMVGDFACHAAQSV